MKKIYQKRLVLIACGFASAIRAMHGQGQEQGEGLSDNVDTMSENSGVGVGMNSGGTIFSGAFLAPDVKESLMPPTMPFIPTKQQYNKLKKRLIKSVQSDNSAPMDTANKH